MIGLADLKSHLNLTTDTDDALLTGKLAAAQEWVAEYLGEYGCDQAPVREATLQLAAHLYENREASLVGVTAQALPFGLIDLLAPYRGWTF